MGLSVSSESGIVLPPRAGGNKELSLLDVLFARTRQRVLAILFTRPDRSFYVNEIIALAGAGRGAVLRELDRLSRSRLVVVTRAGNQKRFQANADSPIFDELCGILKKTAGLIPPIHEALDPVSERIDFAFVFGSVAKGGDTADSDIDLMVVSDELQIGEIQRYLYRTEHRLGRRIGLMARGRDEFAQESKVEDSFISQVMSGPILFVLGSMKEIDEICGT
ncbi:MAG: nucleotidyltransferase domain-containing protein [Gammaproteobacteria bacterium]|nr:nucleotidyltransferase domain-containing protein [Gammaproteobacteria bacterium]MDE0413110.1 nucleotidyltransferase domain-containing protein [Gammaproteobacteria bacterium]